jgi:hypothetical protein
MVQRQKTTPLCGSYACRIAFLIDGYDLGEGRLQQRMREQNELSSIGPPAQHNEAEE